MIDWQHHHDFAMIHSSGCHWRADNISVPGSSKQQIAWLVVVYVFPARWLVSGGRVIGERIFALAGIYLSVMAPVGKKK